MPFRGVPMLIKDLWATEAGQPHHGGVQALKDADFTADEDANLVTRYKEAGFVIVGRTNTPELGLVATTEPTSTGPCRNPWNTGYSTGGSSGGAAAAVATGMVPAAHASDGGGSIRIPAAMCGLVGLKPSRGRVSQGPGEEWSFACQHVVCHTMRDTATILDACAIPFPGDGVVAPDHGRPYAERVDADPGHLRIGLMADNHRVPTHADCEEATRRTADLLAPWFGTVKVGLELFSAAGPEAVATFAESGFDVFCDLKLHDIPNTVRSAARVLGTSGARWVTVHTSGGAPMLQAAVEGLEEMQ